MVSVSSASHASVHLGSAHVVPLDVMVSCAKHDGSVLVLVASCQYSRFPVRHQLRSSFPQHSKPWCAIYRLSFLSPFVFLRRFFFFKLSPPHPANTIGALACLQSSPNVGFVAGERRNMCKLAQSRVAFNWSYIGCCASFDATRCVAVSL